MQTDLREVAAPYLHATGVGKVLGLVVATLKRDRPRLVAALRVSAAGVERELRRAQCAADR